MSELLRFLLARIAELSERDDTTAYGKLIQAHVAYYGDGNDHEFPVPVLSLVAERFAGHPEFDPAWYVTPPPPPSGGRTR